MILSEIGQRLKWIFGPYYYYIYLDQRTLITNLQFYGLINLKTNDQVNLLIISFTHNINAIFIWTTCNVMNKRTAKYGREYCFTRPLENISTQLVKIFLN